jgi:hypothetical protein
LDRDILVKHVATRHYAGGLVQSEYVVGAQHAAGADAARTG